MGIRAREGSAAGSVRRRAPLPRYRMPRGHHALSSIRFSWKRLSLPDSLAFEPDGSDAHLVVELRPGAYKDKRLIEFMTVLKELVNVAVAEPPRLLRIVMTCGLVTQ